jgi:hypothetical protein
MTFSDINNKNNYDIIKKEKENSSDIYPESNSLSHLSTTSEGENNYYFYSSKLEEKKIDKINKNKNIYESITKGIKDISDNFIPYNIPNTISFACYYYCDVQMDEQTEFFLGAKIQNLENDCKKNFDEI